MTNKNNISPLNECFRQLIRKRAWYKNSNVTRRQAYRDKLYFEKDILPEQKIRFYLKNAGYELYQEELWKQKNENIEKNVAKMCDI